MRNSFSTAQEAADHLPPYSEEYERGVLGSVMLDAKRVLELCAAAGIGAEAFYVPAHQVLYRHLCAMRDQSQPVDLLAVAETLRAAEKLDALGGPQFLERLIDATPTAAHAEFYIRHVASLAERRGLIATLQLTLEQSYDKAGPDTTALVVELVKSVNKFAVTGNTVLTDAATWISESPPPTEPVLLDTFDVGDKIPIIGSSKSRKSFFLLQLALMLASGRDFLFWRTAKQHRVLLIQLEVKEAHYWRRVHNLARAMGVTPEMIGDRLHVASWRGHEIKPGQIRALARRHHAQVIMLDPLYKLVPGDENLAVDMKPVLAEFDQLAEETGAAVLYVHHNPKGRAGDRDARDRGAGSGVIARDFDAAIYLTDHKEDGLLVCETLLRNYAPQEPFTLEWDNGRFVSRDDIEAVVRTSKNHKAAGRTGPTPTDDDALAVVAGEPLTSCLLMEALRKSGFTKRAAEVARERLLKEGKLTQFSPPAYPKRVWFGTPAHIADLKHTWENPDMPEIK